MSQNLYVFTGVREQSIRERRTRRADRVGRQLRREQYGARAADTHAEHTGNIHLATGYASTISSSFHPKDDHCWT